MSPDRFFPIAQENGVVAFSPVVVASDLTAIGDFIFPGKSLHSGVNSKGSQSDSGKTRLSKSSNDK